MDIGYFASRMIQQQSAKVMISKTSKKVLGKSGKPSWIPVPYTQCKNSWVRIKLTDDSVSDWFYTGSYYSVFECAAFCAEGCVEKLHLYKYFVGVVLNSAKHIDVKQNNKIGMLYNRAKSFFHQIRQGGKTK